MYFHSRIGIYRGVIFRDVLNSSYSHSPCGLIFLYISQTSSTAYHTLTPFWVLFKLTARQRALFHISSSLFLCSLKICQSCQSCNLAFTYSRSSTKDPGWPPAELDPSLIETDKASLSATLSGSSPSLAVGLTGVSGGVGSLVSVLAAAAALLEEEADGGV